MSSETAVTAREVLARQYTQGTTVTNCVLHSTLSLLERPNDCRLCLTDLRNALQRAWAVNEWLNQWRDDATTVLTRQEAALLQLQGWEVVHDRVSSYDAGRLARHFIENGTAMLAQIGDGEPGPVLAGGMDPRAAQLLVNFFEKLLEVADGITPAADVLAARPGAL